VMCTLGVSLSLALGWSEESWVEARSKASVAYAKGSKGYTLTATLSSKRHSESDATIQVSMVGADGTQTEWETLGSGWTTAMMGKERKVEIRFQSVGSPAQLLLKTDSSDGTLFESVTVEAPGVDKVYFDASGISVRCRSSGWFGFGASKCESRFAPSAEPSDGGDIVCHERKSPAPIKSSFSMPTGAVKLSYTGFTVYMDCNGAFGGHGAFRFEYIAKDDCGKLERRGSFSLDPKFDKTCQQTNGNAYPETQGISFDRGHLVPANHLDHDKEAIYQSNYMTNILPQAAKMNRGAWLRSEEIIECLRVTEDLYVAGGAVYDKDYRMYNWFQSTHNVKTPIFFWKLIKAQTLHPETGHYLALWIPNDKDAVKAVIDDYVISIDQLEKNLAKYGQSQTFDISSKTKAITPKGAWPLPFGCDPQL